MTQTLMAWEELAEEPTETLINCMQWRDQPDYKDLAEDAFIIFYKRFGDKVQTTCRILAENRGYDDRVADKVAENVFAKFLKYPNFNADKCKFGDVDKCVELYLYKFAERGLSDFIADEKNPFSGDEEIVTEFPDIEIMDLPVESKAQLQHEYEIIKKALARLTPKHKTIYLTYKQYEFDLKNHYFKHTFLERLQKQLQLSQASIRVYKKEAFDKIEEYLKIYGEK